MERALALDLLTGALGSHVRLPSPTELQRLLSRAEVGLFTRRVEFDPPLLDVAWYLQAVAVARNDLQIYEPVRQRQAHQVSGHIFDLALQSETLSELERLQYTLAAQVAYIGGGLVPNAGALLSRAVINTEPTELASPDVVSLESGILLLALDRPGLYALLGRRIAQLAGVSDDFEPMADSPYAVAEAVIRGVRALLEFMTSGRRELLERGQQVLRGALASNGASGDLESRWVAAHLLRTSEGLEQGAVWTALPPDATSAARAMTLGEPPVLQLWPPQLSFLAGETDRPSPMDPVVRRLVLSFPTSAGKSLLAQLLVTVHLVNGQGDVCVVAPTHSLCRELGLALQRRLRTLGLRVHEDSLLWSDINRPAAARVVVMTPEKLAGRLRSDPVGLLADFGMFVIDEAHLLADSDRGWRLEETLSLLHELTRATHHRLLILSAALGSQAHVMAWLDPGDGVVAHHENWRGPRRLNVVFTTAPDWPNAIDEPRTGTRLPRRTAPLSGIVHLRTGVGNSSIRGRFSEPVGTLVLRQQKTGKWVKDTARSSTHRSQLVPLIQHVAAAGSVLIVQATKTEAQRLAEELAAPRHEDPNLFGLTDLVRARLSDDHPLTQIISKGVAFHHAALPVDIQAEIEDAVRAERIRILVSTSTLTEGVNLPFKTVIVAQRGYRDSDGYVEVIDGARLLNAVGRAGRAGRETEGWLILVEQEDFADEMFEPLDRTGRDLELRSTMATASALEQLAVLEAAARESEDSVFSTSAGTEADAFVSFTWFIAQTLTELRNEVSEVAVLATVRSTLAWQQLDEDGRQRLAQAAARAYGAFTRRPEEQRRRWARSGMSLPSAASIETVAEELLAVVTENVESYTLSEAVEWILGNGRLQTLLSLAENHRRGFKSRRNAPYTETVSVDIMRLIIDWVSGAELQTLGDSHLSGVTREDYRYEQLSEFIASVLEHFLPWALGVVVTWLNEALEREDRAYRVSEDLSAAVHFGVATRDALALMNGGVRSRRLANQIGAIRLQDPQNDHQSLREWLSSQDLAAWRSDFEASPTELADLLTFSRDPNVQLVYEVLEGDEYTLPYTVQAPVLFESPARLRRQDGQPAPAPFAILVGDEVVGRVNVENHDDIELLTRIGIPLDISVRPGVAPALVFRVSAEAVDA